MKSILRKGNLKSILGLSLLSIGVISSIVYAANTPNFTIKINPGTLAIDVVDPASYDSISTPVFNIGGDSIPASMSSFAANGILGDDINGNIYISNPDATNSWTASIAVNSDNWTSVENNTFPYNSDVADNGQLAIDPSVGSIVSGRSNLELNGSDVTLATASAFSSTVSSITIAQANALAPRISDFLIKNIAISQTVPAQTPAGDYVLDMTMSVIGEFGVQSLMANIPIQYDGGTVAGSNIYVGPGDSVDLDTTSYGDVDWSISDQGYYAALDTTFIPARFSTGGNKTSGSLVTVMNNNLSAPTNVKIIAQIGGRKGSGNVGETVIHFGTGKQCPDNRWVSTNFDCSITGPTITYNSQTIPNNGHIYTNIGSWTPMVFNSDDSTTIWSWNFSNYYRSMYYNETSYYQGQQTSNMNIQSQPSYASPEDVIVTAKGSNNIATRFTVHYGTGQNCSNGAWISNSDTCPINPADYGDETSCLNVGMFWYSVSYDPGEFCGYQPSHYTDQPSCESANFGWYTDHCAEIVT